MEPNFSSWWTPTKVFAAIFGGAIALDSIIAVWGERRPVGGFFEELFARVATYGVPAGSIAAGILVGAKATNVSGQSWIGWIVGIAVALLFGGAGTILMMNIPGVDWRYERILDSQGGDY